MALWFNYSNDIRNVDVIVAINLWHKSNAILAIQHP